MNIIVTGASKGIGYDVVLEFSKSGDNKIIAIARDYDKLIELQKKCFENYQNKIEIVKFDITEDAAHNNDLLSALKEIETVDILINNAAVLINKKFEDLSEEDWSLTFSTNVFGPVNLIKLIYSKLKNSRFAHIINISSIGGLERTKKFSGLSAYSASKAALVNLTECMAEEFLEDNIFCNCLSLGSVNTEMFREAFPSYSTEVSSTEISKFICDFSKNYRKFFNGKVIPIAISTP